MMLHVRTLKRLLRLRRKLSVETIASKNSRPYASVSSSAIPNQVVLPKILTFNLVQF
jgi:hypothetical protein